MKKILAIILAAVMLFALAACGGGGETQAPSTDAPSTGEPSTEAPATGEPSTEAPAGDFDEITLNWGLTPAAASGDAESAERLAGLIGDKTGGSVTVEVFPGATLGGEDVMLEGLLSGTVDMANVSPNVVATVAPEMNALCLPFLYDNFNAARSVITSEEYTAKINEVLEPYGLHYLGVSYICPRTITGNDEFHTPADCSGQVIRVMGGEIFSDIYKAWNLNTTIISWGECYTAMQQHTVDGVDGGNEPSIDMAFYEVAKYNVQLDYIYHAQMTLISTDKWNSLTPDTQAAISEAAAENLNWADDFSYDHWVEDSEAVQNDPYNMINIELTPEERQAWVDAVQPVYEKYSSIIGEDFYNWIMDYAAAANEANAA